MTTPPAKTVTLDELTVTQLKALLFDEIEKIRSAETNIQVLRQELARRQAPSRPDAAGDVAAPEVTDRAEMSGEEDG